VDSPATHPGDCPALQTLPGVHSERLSHLRFDCYLLLLYAVKVRAFWQLGALHSEPINPLRSSMLEPTVDLDRLFEPQGQRTLHLHGCCSDPD